MKILVFGANGFLGTALLPLLKNNGFEVCSVSRSSEHSNYHVDISRFDDFSKLPFDYFDTVINCATTLPGGDYLANDYLDKIYKTNILGTQNICKWIEKQSSITQIINCSTLVVVGKPWPINLLETDEIYPGGNHVLYSSSKLTQELIFNTFAKAKKIKVAHLRFSALYSENMAKSGLIWNLIDQAKSKGVLTLKNADKVSADFLHVTDAARIIVAAINFEIAGIINAASGVEISVMKLAEIIASNFEKGIKIENTDEENFIEDRAVINVDKLMKIIDLNTFEKFEKVISKMVLS